MSLELKSRQIRYDAVRLSSDKNIPHLGSNLSCIDILVALYFDVMEVDPNSPQWEGRDVFLMSKGHASPSHYLTLAHRGFFPIQSIWSIAENGSIFEEHSGIDAPDGVETVNGSLGHALGLAAGMAFSRRLRQQDNHHYVLMGDGEINEGTIWEAAMFISANKLNKVTAIIDHNLWQATGRSREVFGLTNIAAMWESFGWNAVEVSGHDVEQLSKALREAKSSDKPTAIVAHTVKGKGISFMEDDNNWHYRVPTKEETASAYEELLSNA